MAFEIGFLCTTNKIKDFIKKTASSAPLRLFFSFTVLKKYIAPDGIYSY